MAGLDVHRRAFRITLLLAIVFIVRRVVQQSILLGRDVIGYWWPYDKLQRVPSVIVVGDTHLFQHICTALNRGVSL